MFDGIIFDFDGLILDTETPLFLSWQGAFEHFGVPPIQLDEWVLSLGLHDDDPSMINPLDRLLSATNGEVDEEEIQAIRRRIRDDHLAAQTLRPGVEWLITRTREMNIPIGIASSSPLDWVQDHVERHGLSQHFPVIRCAGAGVPGKPDPEVYLQACAALGISPSRSLALEDSPHGATAAKAAGMTCYAVPTSVSRNLDFSHADRVLTSVAEVAL